MALPSIPAVPERNNFTALRYGLAFMVVLSHLGELSQEEAFLPFYQFISSQFAIHGFFVISGFLIYRSYLRNPEWKSYLKKRMRRIFPAYLVVVLVAALGLFFLSSEKEFYFSSLDFWKYLVANSVTLNFIQPSLPGVFEQQYTSAVNGALWTIKVELAFYFLLPILVYFLIKLSARGQLWLLIFLYVLSILYSGAMFKLWATTGIELYRVLLRQLPGELCYFISGMLMLRYVDVFRKYSHYMVAAAIGLWIFFGYLEFTVFHPLFIATVIFWIAIGIPGWFSNLDKHDYSYGIYLWHFPLIQCFVALQLFNERPWALFALLMLLIIGVAALSWYGLESKLIRKKALL